MKTTTFTVTYEEDKLVALKMYLEQKGSSLDEELRACLETLYNKNVPTTVREFIAMKAGSEVTEKKRRPKPEGKTAKESRDDVQ